jgi:hypothetical protein
LPFLNSSSERGRRYFKEGFNMTYPCWEDIIVLGFEKELLKTLCGVITHPIPISEKDLTHLQVSTPGNLIIKMKERYTLASDLQIRQSLFIMVKTAALLEKYSQFLNEMHDNLEHIADTDEPSSVPKAT